MLPVSFRFLHEPHTEQEVVCLFMLLLDELKDQHGNGLDQPVLIEKIHSAYPDCTVRAGGRRIRIEFEHFGSDFNHDPSGCDMMVCWVNDQADLARLPPRIVQLAEILGARTSEVIVAVDNPYPEKWTEDAFFRVGRNYETSERDLEVAHRIIELAKAHRLGPHWPRSKRPVFAVGGRCQFFKVGADGRLKVSTKGVPPRLRAELFDRLVTAVPDISIDPKPTSKRHGGHLAVIFENDERLLRYFDVWKWLDSAL